MWARLAVLCVIACGCAEVTGSDSRALANADGDSEYAAVVALYADGSLFCTGTVIAPRVVLTAAHCLAGAGSQAVIEADIGGARVATSETVRHPDWRFDSLADDIALLALADDATVEPIAPGHRTLGAADEGTVVTLVGFGLTTLDGDDDGVQRSGSAPITGVGASQLSINGGDGAPSACPGDSGGPSLLDDTVIGVHSRASCATLTLDERVDVHVTDFIDPFVAAHPPGDGGCSGGPGGAALWLIALAATGVRSRCSSRARQRGAPPRTKDQRAGYTGSVSWKRS